MLGNEKFGIVVTDFMLGNDPGLEIFDYTKSVPVIVITGNGDIEMAIKAL